MKQIVTNCIVLGRTDYGEADRILTLLTPDQGKIRVLAKGVRRVKSKLAGGIELFSTSEISFLRGRGELGTLISSRLSKHYGNIVSDISRVQLGYELIKQLNRATEDEPEAEYYRLLEQTFEALDDASLPLDLVQTWFQAQLLAMAGHTPNLQTDNAGLALDPAVKYTFDFDHMAFAPASQGTFGAGHIKVMRLLFARSTPGNLSQVGGLTDVLPALAPVIKTALNTFIRI